jgi:hypothetical protein
VHRLDTPAPSEQESVGQLVSRLGMDVRRIVQAEIGLFQARAQAVLGALKAAGALIAVGVVCALGGIGALVAGIVLVVAQWLLPWAAALIVGAGLLLIAGILLYVQSRVVAAGVREALSEVRVEIRGEERYGGQ